VLVQISVQVRILSTDQRRLHLSKGKSILSDLLDSLRNHGSLSADVADSHTLKHLSLVVVSDESARGALVSRSCKTRLSEASVLADGAQLLIRDGGLR